MKHIAKTSIVFFVISYLFTAGALAAANPAAETFTAISTSGHVGGSLPSFYSETPNGSTTVTNTHRKDANTSITSDGYLEGQGVADFGILKNRLELGGPSGLDGINRSLFNDHWTIHNTLLTGQPGVMTLAFDLSGSALVMDTSANTLLSDEYAGVGLIVDINPTTTSNGTRALDYHASLGSGQMQVDGVQGSPTVTLPINFTYGQEFGVRVSLRTSAQSDNMFLGVTFTPSYFEYYGGGIIDSITVDFLNTAQLGAIVLPDDPLTSLSSSSLTDFSSLITDSLPVPEPATLLILGLGGFLLRRNY